MSGEESSAEAIVRVEIVALDGVLGESLELRARWSIAGAAEENDLLTRRSVRTEKPVGDPPLDAWAAAVSRAFAGLAQEIADQALVPR